MLPVISSHSFRAITSTVYGPSPVSVLAKVAARRGDREGAARLLAEATELAREVGPNYWPIDRDTAEVLELAGRLPEALQALDAEIAKLEKKGIVPVAEQAKKRRAALLLELEQ